MLGGAVAAGISYSSEIKNPSMMSSIRIFTNTRKKIPLLMKMKRKRKMLRKELILRSTPEKTQRPPMILQQKKEDPRYSRMFSSRGNLRNSSRQQLCWQRDLQQMKKHPPL